MLLKTLGRPCLLAGNLSKIYKRAGWNKAVQVGISKDNRLCNMFIRYTLECELKIALVSLDLKSGFNHLNSFLNYFKYLCIHI